MMWGVRNVSLLYAYIRVGWHGTIVLDECIAKREGIYVCMVGNAD